MRFILPVALLFAGACGVESDTTNEQVTVKYDKERIKKSAQDAGRTARDVASGVGNVTKSTGRAIKNEVGDVDVDVKVTRNRADQTN